MSKSSEPRSNSTTVTMLPPRGMISVRADLKSKKLNGVILELTGADIPEVGRFSYSEGTAGCIWMSPDELLVLVAQAAIDDSEKALKQALSEEHNLVSNVSDARAIIQIKGPNAGDVLARLTPANVSQPTFQPGHVRRSRISQVAAGFWMLDPETVELICFRSSADYAFGLLEQASCASAAPHFYSASA